MTDQNFETTSVEPSAVTVDGTNHEAVVTNVAVTNCALCGKLLTDPESVKRGIGPECFGKAQAIMTFVGLTAGDQPAELSADNVQKARAMYYDLMSFKEQPSEAEWMPLKEAFDWFNENGVPAARLNRLCGGDRPLPDEKRPEAFEVRYFKGRRYIRRSTITEALLEEQRNAGSTARAEAAAARREAGKAEKEAGKAEREQKKAEAKLAREQKAAERIAKAQEKAAAKVAAAAAKAQAADGSEPAAPKAKKASTKKGKKVQDVPVETSVEF